MRNRLGRRTNYLDCTLSSDNGSSRRAESGYHYHGASALFPTLAASPWRGVAASPLLAENGFLDIQMFKRQGSDICISIRCAEWCRVRERQWSAGNVFESIGEQLPGLRRVGEKGNRSWTVNRLKGFSKLVPVGAGSLGSIATIWPDDAQLRFIFQQVSLGAKDRLWSPRIVSFFSVRLRTTESRKISFSSREEPSLDIRGQRRRAAPIHYITLHTQRLK